MAIISFEDYAIDNVSFLTNTMFEGADDLGKLHTEVSFSAEIGISYENARSYVIIKTQIGNCKSEIDSTEVKHVPFQLEVDIRGIYSLNFSDFKSVDNLKDVLSTNAIAILYPYLRSFVSTLTAQVNSFPAYVLPVVNFAETLRENNLVEYWGFDELPLNIFNN